MTERQTEAGDSYIETSVRKKTTRERHIEIERKGNRKVLIRAYNRVINT